MPGITCGVRAQGPEVPGPTTQPEGSDQPLSLRYRFIESYGLAEDAGRPDLIVQYQVGSIETIRRELEKERGAPDRQEIEYRTIYTERPTRVARPGEVDTRRRYDVFRAGGVAQADPRMAILLRGLDLWYHPRAGTAPELISMTPGRPIRQLEYDTVIGQLYFPRLSAVFSPLPVRKADTWSIPRQAAHVLLGKVPEAGNYRLEGTLTQVDKGAQGADLTAIIDISGEIALEEGEGAIRARIWFVFQPLTAAAAATPKGLTDQPARGVSPRDTEIVEARGYISKVQMTRRLALPLDEEGRLQEIGTRELQAQRRKVPSLAGSPGVASLLIPEKPPVADEKNSWLLFDDPEGRYHFSHPQEMAIQTPESNPLVLHRVRPDGKADTLLLGAVPKEADSARDRKWSDPQAFVKDLQQNVARRGEDLIPGPMGWLPEQEWSPLKRKVYRYEVALKKNDSPRHYLDAYLILFASGDHFVLQAMTNRDDHIDFRNQAESLIKTLDLGPSNPAMAARAPQRAAPSRPTAPSTDRSAPPAVPRLDRSP